jgi:gamma-glutamylcyclotransferase (GGCT)/AIG2-like uncharacterized protein YtfP
VASQAQGTRSRSRGAHRLKLFVYGTLAPGYDAWSVLEPWVTGTPAADAVPGHLYDTGRGYPGATFLAEGETGSVVHGMVVTLDPGRETAALRALDRYEGPEYARVTVRTQAGITVAAYAWIAPLTGCMPVNAGRWRDLPQAETPRPDGR